MKYIDMHLHSSVSDGELSPALLAEKAFDASLSAAAICDHDTGDGIEEFMLASERLGIEGIPSIEIGADFKTEMHILGYFIDYKSDKFQSSCAALRDFRRTRNEETSALLAKNAVHVTPAEAKRFASGDICGRLHFALAMVEKGYVSSVNEAFDRYLGSGRCAYSPHKLLSPRETIELISSCGGFPVLAHPFLMKLDKDETFAVLKELKDAGLFGVECFHSTQDGFYSAFLYDAAEKLSLAVTSGSDYHGVNKPHVSIGEVYGGEKIPCDVLEKFKLKISTKK